jgi:hypothetical protein
MNRYHLTLLVPLLIATSSALAAGSYVPGTEDVPLMHGLAPVTEAAIVFDKPQGRIIEATANGAVRRSDVVAFYAASLPQLGWHDAGRQRFEREGERLSLDFGGRDGNLQVDFTLEPELGR